MKITNYKTFPFIAIFVCMIMISSFAADRQIKTKKVPVDCVKKTQAKVNNLKSSPTLAAYILQVWRM